jgi:probable F420-dependent oxidoreductase
MKIGIGLQWADWRHMTSSTTLKDVALKADSLGFASLWSTDRLTARTGPAPSSEALITLASLIHVVPEMQLGVAVLVLPPRNAVIVAKQAATLSVLSGGRLRLGIGAGWNEDEFKLLGSDHASRGKRMDESIQVMRRLWQDDKASFDGQYYNFEEVTMAPRPVGGGVPLWIGGNSRAAIRRAATMGDGWLPSGPDPQRLRSGVERLRELSSGRQMPTIAATLFVDASLSGREEGSRRPQVAGSVQQMVQTLRAYESAGLEHLIINLMAVEMDELTRQMRTFSQDVLPHFSE